MKDLSRDEARQLLLNTILMQGHLPIYEQIVYSKQDDKQGFGFKITEYSFRKLLKFVYELKETVNK